MSRLHPRSRRASDMLGQHAQLTMWIRMFGPARPRDIAGWERKRASLAKSYLTLVGEKISEK